LICRIRPRRARAASRTRTRGCISFPGQDSVRRSRSRTILRAVRPFLPGFVPAPVVEDRWGGPAEAVKDTKIPIFSCCCWPPSRHLVLLPPISWE
jgi:hypothetical protein